jgi:phosphopantetheinyl transferase (holo-ACP synthase)
MNFSLFGYVLNELVLRWAAKEAVIKAHSHRPLYMREISIVIPSKNPSMYSAEFGKEDRLIALIDPPTDTILMDENVAKMRALRGCGHQNGYLRQEKLLMGKEIDIKVWSKTTGDQDLDGLTRGSEKKTTYRRRRAKIDESQRQIAEISISHDGNTAVAMCVASVEPGSEKEPKLIVDDGSSPPMHEPQWGDHGFLQYEGNVKRLDLTHLEKEEGSRERSNYLT